MSKFTPTMLTPTKESYQYLLDNFTTLVATGEITVGIDWGSAERAAGYRILKPRHGPCTDDNCAVCNA